MQEQAENRVACRRSRRPKHCALRNSRLRNKRIEAPSVSRRPLRYASSPLTALRPHDWIRKSAPGRLTRLAGSSALALSASAPLFRWSFAQTILWSNSRQRRRVHARACGTNLQLSRKYWSCGVLVSGP